MENYVQPAPDGIVGRVLPSLQPVPMRQIVRRLPVVEGLIAVLDWGKQGGYEARCEETIEGGNGLDGIHARRPAEQEHVSR